VSVPLVDGLLLPVPVFGVSVPLVDGLLLPVVVFGVSVPLADGLVLPVPVFGVSVPLVDGLLLPVVVFGVSVPLVVPKDVEEAVALHGALLAKFCSHTSVEFLDPLLDALSSVTGGG
jgi:hypothetical protein